MSGSVQESYVEVCKRLEAFETPGWAIDAVLGVELTTHHILDPCCGLGAIGHVCRGRELDVEEFDVEDWSARFPGLCRREFYGQLDFFDCRYDLANTTVIMNPPFSRAEEFVDHAMNLGARKVICFQRQAWRESVSRRAWWDRNPPARVWVCGARATCWRFDLLTTGAAGKSGSTTSMAWYIWERGHKGAEVTSAIYPRGKA